MEIEGGVRGVRRFPSTGSAIFGEEFSWLRMFQDLAQHRRNPKKGGGATAKRKAAARRRASLLGVGLLLLLLDLTFLGLGLGLGGGLHEVVE